MRFNQSTTTSGTVIEALVSSLETAARYNLNDVVRPCVVLWTDYDSQWLPIIPQLRRLLPQLLVLGNYAPENRTGPAIWLRCVLDGEIDCLELPENRTGIIYLPGVSRQILRAVQECPDRLKPLVELQYRGVCWTQNNGKDWTVEAFLVSENGGLGLDIARDVSTRRSMLSALTELATTSVMRLSGKRLEAEDFDKLFSDDHARDLLLWLSDPEHVRSRWSDGRWRAFRSRSKAEFKFDPDKDGSLVAAESLGRRQGCWASVWERFAESPNVYPGVPEHLRKAMPNELFLEPSSWPQNHERDEDALRDALLALESKPASMARDRVLELERVHGERRDWVWTKLAQTTLCGALGHLAEIARRTANRLGGASVAEMTRLYADGGWKVDSAALSAMAAVKSTADSRAIEKVLDTIYRPWLESAAEHLQALADKEPSLGRDNSDLEDLRVGPGGVMLFADGLRFDVSQWLVSALREKHWSIAVTTRWAALPTVTATAKPAVSPVTKEIKGLALKEDFLPATANGGQPLTTDRFRKLLAAAGYQYVKPHETGDPTARAWSESGEIDKLGHSIQTRLAGRVEEEVDLLVERIESLLDAGWKEVCVVTDHGWLWLPGGLPKVELPKFLTASRWARCAAIKGGSNVDFPTVRWHWNSNERIAVAPGIACFGTGYEYAHGGLSLQEGLVAVIRVTASEEPRRTVARFVDVTWAGLRCRVRIEPVQTGLSVDLRRNVSDPESSVSTLRQVDGGGAASLLVTDDELYGIPVAVVVLDASGNAVAKQPTIIGG